MSPLEIFAVAVILFGVVWCAVKLAETDVIVQLANEDRDHHKNDDGDQERPK